MARGRAQPAGGATELFRAKEGFAVPGADGLPRVVPNGALLRGDDPLVATHRGLLEPASNAAVEAATAAPGERRNLRLPSGRPLSEVTEYREGQPHHLTTAEGDTTMPHRGSLDPSDVNSPASTFAPAQPAAGVVAPDVPDVQNPAGAPKAGEENVDVQEYVETPTDPSRGAGPVPAGAQTEEEQAGEGDTDAARRTGSGGRRAGATGQDALDPDADKTGKGSGKGGDK
jgi:hypothetical protein